MGCFVAGLPMVCNGGVYLFTLMDWHTASWAILLLGIAEVNKLMGTYMHLTLCQLNYENGFYPSKQPHHN